MTVQAEAHAQARTDPAFHVRYILQILAPAHPAIQAAAIRIVNVVLLHAVAFVEAEFAGHLGHGVAGRQHLEHNLRRDTLLPPLHIGTPVARWAAKHHHRVGRGPQSVIAFDRIPEQIAGHEHVGSVGEQRGQATLNRDDVAELPGVVGHGLSVAVGVNDLGGWRGKRPNGHTRPRRRHGGRLHRGGGNGNRGHGDLPSAMSAIGIQAYTQRGLLSFGT